MPAGVGAVEQGEEREEAQVTVTQTSVRGIPVTQTSVRQVLHKLKLVLRSQHKLKLVLRVVTGVI